MCDHCSSTTSSSEINWSLDHLSCSYITSDKQGALQVVSLHQWPTSGLKTQMLQAEPQEQTARAKSICSCTSANGATVSLPLGLSEFLTEQLCSNWLLWKYLELLVWIFRLTNIPQALGFRWIYTEMWGSGWTQIIQARVKTYCTWYIWHRLIILIYPFLFILHFVVMLSKK